MDTKEIEDIRNRLIHARLCHEAWWIFAEDHPERARMVETFNLYPEFFGTVDPALFCAWVVKLASLFDKGDDSIGLKSLPNVESDSEFSDIWGRGRRLYRYRSKMIAHRADELFQKDFARETGFRLKDFGRLIEDICDLFDRCVVQKGHEPIERFSLKGDVSRLVQDLDGRQEL